MYEKIGLHIIEGYNRPLGRAPVITVYNPSVAYVEQIRAECGPDCLIVCRYPLGSDGSYPVYDNALPRARVRLQWRNEPTLNSVDDAIRFMDQEREWLRHLHNQNRRGAICVPSVGNFLLHVWETLAPLKDDMLEGDVVAVHEYWSSANLSRHMPWHCARFSMVEWLWTVPIIVTEIGRDRIQDESLPPSEWGASGWKRSGISAEQYLSEIQTYNEQALMPYDNVIGATLFTVGNDSRWRDYDVADVYQVIRKQRDSSEPPPPPPPPPPDPDEPTCEDVRVLLYAWANDADQMAKEMRDMAGRICKGSGTGDETIANS